MTGTAIELPSALYLGVSGHSSSGLPFQGMRSAVIGEPLQPLALDRIRRRTTQSVSFFATIGGSLRRRAACVGQKSRICSRTGHAGSSTAGRVLPVVDDRRASSDFEASRKVDVAGRIGVVVRQTNDVLPAIDAWRAVVAGGQRAGHLLTVLRDVGLLLHPMGRGQSACKASVAADEANFVAAVLGKCDGGWVSPSAVMVGDCSSACPMLRVSALPW